LILRGALDFDATPSILAAAGRRLAIRIANDTPYGLAFGIQTRNLGRALMLADRIKAGTVWINTWYKYHPNAPFGGYKMSGYGREQGAEALEGYTQYKSVWANLA
jgi:aldehyde dehydrogenase (NAD+)